MIVRLLQNMGLSRDVPGFANKSILFARLLHIFGSAGNTVHASAMLKHLHCSRLLRIFATVNFKPDSDMEIFYSETLRQRASEKTAGTKGLTACLNEDESAHCIRVLRHRSGDIINVIDGQGGMHECVISDPSPKRCGIIVKESHPDWGGHGYVLHVACCPTKNIDRFEWFMEKATEIGIDTITPIIGEHSERKTVKRERCERILLAAAKQSLKGKIPELGDCISVHDFISSAGSPSIPGNTAAGCEDMTGAIRPSSPLKLIAYCFHGEEGDTRRDMFTEIENHIKNHTDGRHGSGTKPEIIVMIGPEGDFSEEEARHAISCGFIPVSIGSSRLRTETAALMAAAATYAAASRLP